MVCKETLQRGGRKLLSLDLLKQSLHAIKRNKKYVVVIALFLLAGLMDTVTTVSLMNTRQYVTTAEGVSSQGRWRSGYELIVYETRPFFVPFLSTMILLCVLGVCFKIAVFTHSKFCVWASWIIMFALLLVAWLPTVNNVTVLI
jgi:hypothetical protein